MQRRGAVFHPALPDVLETVRMNGQPAHGQHASTAGSVRPPLCLRGRDPHGGGSRALTWNWPGRVFSLEWMLIYGRWETAVRLMGAASPVFPSLLIIFLCRLISTWHTSCFTFYPNFLLLLLSRVCGHIHLRLNIIETRNTEGLSRIFRFIYFFWY